MWLQRILSAQKMMPMILTNLKVYQMQIWGVMKLNIRKYLLLKTDVERESPMVASNGRRIDN